MAYQYSRVADSFPAEYSLNRAFTAMGFRPAGSNVWVRSSPLGEIKSKLVKTFKVASGVGYVVESSLASISVVSKWAPNHSRKDSVGVVFAVLEDIQKAVYKALEDLQR